jgi:hypothetical protein
MQSKDSLKDKNVARVNRRRLGLALVLLEGVNLGGFQYMNRTYRPLGLTGISALRLR